MRTVALAGPDPGCTLSEARVEALLRLDDDPAGFAPEGGALRDLWRRFPGDCVGRAGPRPLGLSGGSAAGLVDTA